MFNEPRNWKWMVPATVAALCLWGLRSPGWWEAPLAGVAGICALAAAVNLWIYVWSHVMTERVAMRQALNSTPQVRLFEAARSMHPDAVRWLMLQQRTVWQIKYVPRENYVDWVLADAPSIHVGFVRFVLENSTTVSMMPMRLLADGSKKFDPDGLVTDREQWTMLKNLLVGKLMCTEAMGNQAPQWLPPWVPETLMLRFGIVNSDEAEEEAGVLGKTVERAREWKELEPNPPAPSLKGRGAVQEPEPLTEEEEARLAEINAAYAYAGAAVTTRK